MKGLIRGCSRCGCLMLLTLALVLAILIALIALVQRATAQTPEPQIIPLVPPLEARRSTGPLPRTFYESEVSLSYCGGRVWLAGAPDLGPHPLRTDDELVLLIISEEGGGAVTTRRLVLNFQSPDHSRIIARSGPVEITSLFSTIWEKARLWVQPDRQEFPVFRLSQKPTVWKEFRLRVQLVDRTPPEYSSGPYWLILEQRCVPAPTPTMRAQATPTASAILASPAPATATSRPATPIQATPTLTPPAPMLGLRPIDSEAEPPGSTNAPWLGPVVAALVAAALVGAALIAVWIAWVVLGRRPGSPEPLNLYRAGILDLFDRETLKASTELLYRYPQGALITHRPLRLVTFNTLKPDNAIAHILPDADGALLQEIGPDGQPIGEPVPLAPGRSYFLAKGQIELRYRNPFQMKGGQRQ